MIKIIDWTGKILFQGHHKDKEVDIVLDANRCDKCPHIDSDDICHICDDTGYSGDFHVEWADESNEENVYEYINY